MNILYLIGNGFDKAQGLNTSYPEFYSWLLKQKPQNDFEKRIYNELKDNYSNWSDLEEALGHYSITFSKSDEFRSVIRYIKARLKEYLFLENEKLQSLSLNRAKIVSDLREPYHYLEGQGREIYRRLFSDVINSPILVDVVSFNYTSTFEKAIGDRSLLGTIGIYECRFRQIIHIHGDLNSMILVGVDNEEQIDNTSFRADDYLRVEFIKPEINEGCQNTNNGVMSSLINNADLIVLFGLSIGITDSTWWQLIGKRLDDSFRRPLLLYFPYDPSKDTDNTPNYKLIWANEYIEFLKDRMKISTPIESLKKIICVGINKDFLKLV